MADTGNIQYISRQNIDTTKWDACIDNASNGLIYAYSFYLDHMARRWDALVLNDYEAVMPLTWNKKYGFCYLYQPPFVACSGVFGNNITASTVTKFLDAVPQKFKLIEISLNQGNFFFNQDKPLLIKDNFILPLDKSYDELYNNYRDNIKRNIKRSIQSGCYFKTNIPVNDIINLNKEQLRHLVSLTDADYENFRLLYEGLLSKKMAITYGIYGSNNELLSSCAYFFSHNRAYYILVGNHPNGKTLGASHYLIDRFIADNCRKDLSLDFEGSDIRNLAFFYSSFGAMAEKYPALRINNLPWWVKWMKK